MRCGLFLLLLVNMNYENIIIDLLHSVGNEGMSVKDISRYVYNSQNSFFNPLDYTAVYRNVASLLVRISHKTDSVIKKSPIRGRYCIDYSSSVWKQMKFQFDSADKDEEISLPNDDTALSLF